MGEAELRLNARLMAEPLPGLDNPCAFTTVEAPTNLKAQLSKNATKQMSLS
jgi:hypothetical protein